MTDLAIGATFSPKVRAHAIWLGLAAALLVAVPSLTLGFVTDDYGFRAVLHAPAPHARPAYDLFRFAAGDAATNERAIRGGHLPWWSSADLRIHFVRPLTGLVFAMEDALFGSHAVFDHVSSIVWYLALVAVVGALYRRVFPSGAVAAVATLVFAWSHAHVHPYAWLAARHVLVGGLPAVVSLWAHVRWRSDGWRPGRWLAPSALIVGFFGSEVALAGAAYILAFELLRDRASPLRARLTGSTAPLSIVFAYLLVYRAIGGGARSSGLYHDPFGDPLGFARVAVLRIPALLGDSLLGVPVELSMVSSPARLALVGLLAAVLVAFAFSLSRSLLSGGERASLAWLLPGAMVGVLLGATGAPGGRVLVLPDVGFAALLGLLITRGFEPGAKRGLRGLFAVVLGLAHLVLAPLSSVRAIANFGARARASEAVSESIAELSPPDGRVFLIASDPQVFLYPRGILADTRPGVLRCLSPLSAAHAGHRITRVGDRTLAIEPIERTLLDGSFDTLFRSSTEAFSVGDTVRQCGATLRVTAVRDGRPARLEVTFDAPIDAAGPRVLVWRDRKLARLSPLAMGETTEIPWSPGPTGL
jgi:hypothetical protein